MDDLNVENHKMQMHPQIFRWRPQFCSHETKELQLSRSILELKNKLFCKQTGTKC